MQVAIVSQPRDAIFTSGVQKGSVGIVTWELARRLARRHDVVVYAPRAPGQALTEEAEGVLVRRVARVYRQAHRALELASGLVGLRTPYFAQPLHFREYAQAVAEGLREDPPDCIHVQVASHFVPLFRRAVPDAVIVLHTHDEVLANLDPGRIAPRLAAANAVVTCSDYITRQWHARFPAYARRISTIGNGVDLQRFHPDPLSGDEDPSGRLSRSREVLYVGRISPEKGLHVLAEAFPAILREYPDARLTLVGPAGLLPFGCLSPLTADPMVASLREFYGGGFFEQLRKQVLHAKVGYLEAVMSRLPARARSRVRIVGATDYDALPDLYRRAGVLAAPSVLQEPFGLPVVEALACGLPVVTSRAGGMGELVDDGITGRVVERGDPRGLAGAICDLFSDSERLARMSVAARAAAESRFGWDSAAARLEAVYERAAPVSPPPLKSVTVML
jgi:glycosyltransferase involved in cell wall biosynthesis